MAHEQYPAIRECLRRGEHEQAVRLARKEFARDPRSLVMAASTYFSARYYVAEAIPLLDTLMPRLQEEIPIARAEENADHLDVISTILLSRSDRGDFDEDTSSALRKHAYTAARQGLELTLHSPAYEHTHSLLALTFADIALRSPAAHTRRDGWGAISRAVRDARYVKDIDQRFRILRKSIYLYFKYGRWWVASWHAPKLLFG